MGVAGTTHERADAAGAHPRSPVGSRPAGARYVGMLDRSPAALFAFLLPDRHADPRSDVSSFSDCGY